MESIDPRKLLVKITSALDELKIDYFITGGMAVAVWGRPRSTADIDAVIKIVEPKITALVRSLRKISKSGYIDEETAKKAVRNGEEFNFIDPETGMKVDFWPMKDGENRGEFERRVPQKILGRKVFFISPEDLILSKLVWYQKSGSERRLEDAESVLKVQKNLDLKYLKRIASAQGFLEPLAYLLKKRVK